MNMTQSREVGDEKIPLAMPTRIKLAVGAGAAALAMLANPSSAKAAERSCPSEPVKTATGWDHCTETKLQGIIRPSMLDAAKVLIATAKERPHLSNVIVGKQTITVSLLGVKGLNSKGKNKEFDQDFIQVVTRRNWGSRVPDPNAVESIELSRLKSKPGDKDFTDNQFLDLYAPGARRFKTNKHVVDNGWEAQELAAFKDHPKDNVDYDTANPAKDPGYGTPMSVAKAVTGDMPLLMRRVEADLKHMAGVF